MQSSSIETQKKMKQKTYLSVSSKAKTKQMKQRPTWEIFFFKYQLSNAHLRDRWASDLDVVFFFRRRVCLFVCLFFLSRVIFHVDEKSSDRLSLSLSLSLSLVSIFLFRRSKRRSRPRTPRSSLFTFIDSRQKKRIDQLEKKQQQKERNKRETKKNRAKTEKCAACIKDAPVRIFPFAFFYLFIYFFFVLFFDFLLSFSFSFFLFHRRRNPCHPHCPAMAAHHFF